MPRRLYLLVFWELFFIITGGFWWAIPTAASPLSPELRLTQNRPLKSELKKHQVAVKPMKYQAQITKDGRQLHGQWGESRFTVNVATLTATVFDALDCSHLQQVDQLKMQGKRFIGEPSIDPQTGHIAVGVLLSECVEMQQSAVFVIVPPAASQGGCSAHLVQIPGQHPLPDQQSTYPLKSLVGINYWDRHLQVRHSDASGAVSLLVFQPSDTPAGQYSFCNTLQPGERSQLCPP